jgi:glycosyltransferase involved in cell wall biosynthesis
MRGVSRPSAVLHVAQVAPPFESVPPKAYGGTERVVDALTRELVRRGHRVTLFASGDSTVPCDELVPTVPTSVRAAGSAEGPTGYYASTVLQVLAREGEFDIIHGHLDFAGLAMAARSRVPVVSTFHGRIDAPYAATALRLAAPGLVAISRAQAAVQPDARWAGIVHNGLDLSGAPFERRRNDDLIFVGRITPEKGIVDAIEVARLSGRRLVIVAKIGPSADERAYADSVFRPALERADTEFVGELPGTERDAFLASSYAMIMPGAWPEPFGLAAIEALACGTPVIARRVGALPELIRDGADGFLADDVTEMAYRLGAVDRLDRAAMRASAIDRFSASRMAVGYEAVYHDLLGLTDEAGRGPGT